MSLGPRFIVDLLSPDRDSVRRSAFRAERPIRAPAGRTIGPNNVRCARARAGRPSDGAFTSPSTTAGRAAGLQSRLEPAAPTPGTARGTRAMTRQAHVLYDADGTP